MNKKIFIFGISFLICFAIFSRTVRTGILNPVDFAVTVKLQERIDTSSHLRLADVVANIMEGATFFAGPEFSLFFLLLLTCVVCIDFKKKRFHLRGLIIPLLFGIMTLTEIYGKTVIHHPAPPFFMIKNTTTIFPKYYINDQFSYPSGHTARATFLGLTLYSLFFIHNSLFKNNKAKALAALVIFVYIISVATSRIYLGHHWLSDVVGGFLLGLSASFFSKKAYR